MDDSPVALLALTIPIIALALLTALLFSYFLFVHLRRRRLLETFHEQRMAALSKGVELPAMPEALLRDAGPAMPHPGRALFRGLLWSLVGVGLFIAVRAVDEDGAWFALIPMGVGLAYLFYYWLEGRKAGLGGSEITAQDVQSLQPSKP